MLEQRVRVEMVQILAGHDKLKNAGFQSVRNINPRPTTNIDNALDIDDEQRILELRDAAMFVLSLFYWMLTKREA